MLPNDAAEKIKTYKIQGSDVAKYAIESFKNFALTVDETDISKFIKQLEEARGILFASKKSEPIMRQCINFAINKTKDVKAAKTYENITEKILKCIGEFLNYKNNAEGKVCEYGANIINQDTKILTHCYSKTVLEILKNAKASGKNFTVINTETRPNFTGRMTSMEISKMRIRNVHITESAVARFIKDADLVLIGCDAIDRYGILNKTGTLNIAIISKFYNKPFYVAVPSVKFYKDGKLKDIKEFRRKEEVWEIKQEVEEGFKSENFKSENIEIENIAYDFVGKELISKVISEFGILNFDKTIEKFKGVKFCV